MATYYLGVSDSYTGYGAPTTPTPLAAPTGLAFAATSPTSATVSWNPSANNSGHTVQVASNSAFTTGLQTLQVIAGNASISVSSLSPNAPYYTRVLAKGTGSYSNSPYSAVASGTTPAASSGSQLAAPLGVAAQATSPTEAGASWFSVTGNNGYVARIAQDSAFTIGLQTVTRPANAVNAAFTGLTASTGYFTDVQALAASPSDNSPRSAVYAFSTPAVPVAGYSYKWTAEGDSLTADPARNGYAGNFFRKVQEALEPSGLHGGWADLATAGESIALSMSTQPEIDEVVAALSTTVPNILSLLAPINDLQARTPGTQTFVLYNNLLGVYFLQHGTRNIAFCLTASRAPTLGAAQRAVYAETQVHNNLVRSAFNDGSLNALVLIDLPSDPRFFGFDAPLNTTYFRPDGLHYNETGGTPIITEMVLRAVPFLIANTRKVITATGEFNSATLVPVDIIWQDTDAAFVYTGSFTPFSGSGTSFYGGSFRYTTTAGDSYAYTVPTGGINTVRMEGYTDSGGSTFDAYANNVLVGSGTMNYADPAAARVYFTFTGLVAGDVVKLVKTGGSGLMYADQIVAFKSI